MNKRERVYGPDHLHDASQFLISLDKSQVLSTIPINNIRDFRARGKDETECPYVKMCSE